MILSLTGKATENLALFIGKVALVVNVSSAGLARSTTGFLDISDIAQFFAQFFASSISQLIKGKLRDFQKLLKYFNGTTTSVFNLWLLFGMHPINFVLYSKNLLVAV